MENDVSKLGDDDRQKLADELHALGIRPRIMEGSGSPAHVAMLANTINDMRQVVSIQSNNVNRLFELLTAQCAVSDKQAALIDRILNQHGIDSMLPGERDH